VISFKVISICLSKLLVKRILPNLHFNKIDFIFAHKALKYLTSVSIGIGGGGTLASFLILSFLLAAITEEKEFLLFLLRKRSFPIKILGTSTVCPVAWSTFGFAGFKTFGCSGSGERNSIIALTILFFSFGTGFFAFAAFNSFCSFILKSKGYFNIYINIYI